MKFKKYGEPKENLTMKYNPMNLANSFIFTRMDCLIKTITAEYPGILKKFISILKKRLDNSIERDVFEDKSNETTEIISKFPDLQHYLNLITLKLSLFVDILGISEQQFWENSEMTASNKDFGHSVHRFTSMHLDTLEELIGKNNTIKLFKKNLDNYINTYDLDQKNIYSDLEDMREKTIEYKKANHYGRVRIFGEVENGQFIIRAENCEKIESIKDLNIDPDYLDVIVCYCHILLTKFWNENFVLTQDRTIAKGNPYCEYAFHDTTIVDEVRHPPKEFFDNMWTLNK